MFRQMIDVLASAARDRRGFEFAAAPAKHTAMDQISSVRPLQETDIADALSACSGDGRPVEIRGGGTKSAFGPPAAPDTTLLDLSNLSGITLYEPEELVLSARAGTPIAEIEQVLAQRGQCMAFEPPRFAALYGSAAGATLGGMVACGWSGPRRIRSGAVRDHVLGARAVGGDGKLFKSGGRVVKNVTGFDLPKLLTGSHGTLAVMTEITIKVLPAPAESRTLVVPGLTGAAGIALLTGALGGPYDISGAAHLPAGVAARSAVAGLVGAGASATVLRLEGFGPSVDERIAALERLPDAGGRLVLDGEVSAALWREVRDVAPLVAPGAILWRLSLPPTDAAAAVAAIARGLPVEAYYDWGGGLVWLALPEGGEAHASLIRDLLPSGHATLMRAPEPIRRQAATFHPQPPALAALSRRVKLAFDPAFILAPHRMNFEA
jgi:glycolate oxidase FAD binding subunit